jgi:hypothetical protein
MDLLLVVDLLPTLWKQLQRIFFFEISLFDKISGGIDPWPRDQYLNIWVCKLNPNNDNSQTLGYANYRNWHCHFFFLTIIESNAAVDGIVIHTPAFAYRTGFYGNCIFDMSVTFKVELWHMKVDTGSILDILGEVLSQILQLVVMIKLQVTVKLF